MFDGETKLVIGISIHVPAWIKNSTGRWADDLISEDDFVKGIGFLISNGIIRVN